MLEAMLLCLPLAWKVSVAMIARHNLQARGSRSWLTAYSIYIHNSYTNLYAVGQLLYIYIYLYLQYNVIY